MDVSVKQTMHGHKGPVCSMVEMGLRVWSGSADGTILVWDASTYVLLFSLGHQGGYEVHINTCIESIVYFYLIFNVVK